jgi:hypothetical protein
MQLQSCIARLEEGGDKCVIDYLHIVSCFL